MYIHDFFQNFLKTFLVCFHGAFTSSVIAPDMPPVERGREGGICLLGTKTRLQRPRPRQRPRMLSCSSGRGVTRRLRQKSSASTHPLSPASASRSSSLYVLSFSLSPNPSSLDFFAALKYLIHSLGVMRIHSCDAARRRHWMTLLTAVSMTWWSLSTRWTSIAHSSFCAPTSASACRRLVASEPNLCSLKQANCNYWIVANLIPLLATDWEVHDAHLQVWWPPQPSVTAGAPFCQEVYSDCGTGICHNYLCQLVKLVGSDGNQLLVFHLSQVVRRSWKSIWSSLCCQNCHMVMTRLPGSRSRALKMWV